MNGAAGSLMRRMSYSRARNLVLAAGLGVIAVVAAVMYARRVDTVEVAATLGFVPVFIGFMFWDLAGGILAAVLASLGYFALRYPAIQAIGAGRFSGLLVSRSIAFVLFGLIGGWANRQLETSLDKLELYDQIDDATGLYNARFLLQDTDLEMSRSQRYHTIFSIASLDVPASVFEPLARRQQAGALREIGRLLRDSVRTVDRCVHGQGATHHKLCVVLPETGHEGAEIFAGRLAEKVTEHLSARGIAVTAGQVGYSSITFPGGEDAIAALRAEFQEIDRREHPEEAPAAKAG